MTLPALLLDWYDANRRTLPWRALPGEKADPYRVWLSEIMLQQTTVATVFDYFVDFVARWPTVGDLAAAELDDVLRAWAGLGYYARARNLHKCAQVVVSEHGGRFPASEAALLKLPGIGPYTAAAVAAIAFDLKASPVDGNIERVVSRLHRVETALPAAKPQIAELAASLTPDARCGDFAQALMDLGAMVCTPRAPKCLLCPFKQACRAHRAGDAERFPIKAKKKKKPTRRGVAFWLEAGTGPGARVLLRRRPEKGLLGGMMEIPSSEWRDTAQGPPEPGAPPVEEAAWRVLPGVVRHTFTHFHLELAVWRGRVDRPDPALGTWTLLGDLSAEALPTVMRKVARHVVMGDGAA